MPDIGSAGQPAENALESHRLGLKDRTGRCLLQGVEFVLAPGERLALLGRSGSGKSTLLRLIAGLLATDPLEGEVSVLGLPLDKAHAGEIRRRVGYVFQNAGDMFLTSSVADEVAFGLRAGSEEEMDRRRAAILKHVGLESVEQSLDPFLLPASQRRRLSIACAVSRDPGLLLLDEPSADLDHPGRAWLAGFLKQWPGPLILADEDLALCRAVCARALVLDAGRMVALDSMMNLVSDATLMEAHGILPIAGDRA